MTTPTPDDGQPTERFEPIPPDRAQPTFAPPAATSSATTAPPPVPAPPTAFAAPEPDPVPTSPVVVAPVAAGSGSGGSSRLLTIVLGIAVLVAVAGVSFAIGRTSAPTSPSAVASTGTTPNGATGNGPLSGQGPDANFDLNGDGGPGDDPDGDRGFGGGRPFGIGGLGIEGTVQSVDGTSVTIQTADGATITVETDGNTAYHQQQDAQASDVQPGKTVIITLSGGFRPGRGATNGSATLGTAGSITVVP